MSEQNNSASVNSEVHSPEIFRRILNVPTEPYSYEDDVFCSNNLDACNEETNDCDYSIYAENTTTYHYDDTKDSIILDILKIQGHRPFFTGSIGDSSYQIANDNAETFNSGSKPENNVKTEPPDDSSFFVRSNSNLYLCNDVIKQDESSEFSFNDYGDDTSNQDTRRTRRYTKRKREEECCPVCGITLRVPELENHYNKEIENLSKITNKSVRKSIIEERALNPTYAQVKSHRENRLTAKVKMYATRAKNEVKCPVCSLRMTGLPEEINKHVANCIEEDENSDDLLVVDEEDSFEEYEFADQTRVRAISFVPGGYSALQGYPSRHNTEEEENLNIDVESTPAYGDPQYTELDIIHNTNDVAEEKELDELRKAVMVDSTVQPRVIEKRKWFNNNEENEASKETKSIIKEELIDSKDEIKGISIKREELHPNMSSASIISSLREKIKELEEQNKNVKCLICLESFTKPVVSTTCWHVYCEECWLMTMGVKKLCPQCNMIVFPSDLRRIYL